MSQATLGSTPYRNSNLFSGYYLDERIDDLDAWDCDADAEAAFDELRRLWELEGDLAASYNEDELLTSWIDGVLDILGFGSLAETTLPGKGGYNDRLLFESEQIRRDASLRKRDGDAKAMYGLASAVLEAKQWAADFTERFSETRSYRDASHQIKYYLEHTPERLQWGILTDGKTWRLYGTKDYATETYYEVDLPELLVSGDLEAFKYFYLFFRPEAFREVSGTTFLDTVWNESETATQELGEDLQDNVFTALRVLGEGFVETNDLDIDPDDAAARAELKEQSLVLLYRLMFVLYAESRHLISPDDSKKRAEFEENFSLNELRRRIHEDVSSGGSFTDYSEYSTSMWGRLEDLFRLVDAGEESLGIPSYNGGLFDADAHEFLARNEVSDRYVAEVVYRLGTTHADDRKGFVLADYADLDTRHLGTIYEGLLEHEFRIAPEQYAAVADDGGQVWKPATDVSVAEAVETVDAGELYVVNDDGERKATGAYYTPDYVVTYIVEETIDPLLESIEADLRADGLEPSDREYFARFWQAVLDLDVLDPAMGSGHFLTKATGYLTERVMEVVREQEIQSYDEQDLRRQIAKECIYGVDINGMAVELAKLSMWLETLAADKPLAFLDHHLKTGNSLVGSDITEVLAEDDADEGQLTLMQAAARVRRRTLEHVMELMEDLLAIDNERLEDIKSMEELYDEIRDDPLYGRLFELANVHTAERFGLDVPDGVYEEMAGAIENESEWAEIRERDWFRSSQATASDEDFFHWELEYPEVFFGDDGAKRDDAGFDAVVGNPPYVNSKHIDDGQKRYLEAAYVSTTGRWDLYLPMTEKALSIASGSVSYIEPSMFFRREYGEGLREFIATNECDVREIVDFSDLSVFDSATNYVCIITLDVGQNIERCTVKVPVSIPSFISSDPRYEMYDLNNSDLSSEPWEVIPANVVEIMNSIPESFVSLGSVTDSITEGIHSGRDDVFYVSKSEAKELDLETTLLKPLLKGKDINRYQPPETDLLVIWPYHEDELIPESTLKSSYRNIYSYLSNNRDTLEERSYLIEAGYEWYELWRKREHRIYENPKILLPMITDGSNFTIDSGTPPYFFNTKAKSMKIKQGAGINLKTLLGLLNSKLLEFIYKGISPPKRGGYRAYTTGFLSQLQIPEIESDKIEKYAERMLSANRARENLNLSLVDYLGNHPF